MKNILLYAFCFIIFFGTSCTKDEDNPDKFSVQGGILNFTNVTPGLIDFGDLDNVSASFNIENDGAAAAGATLLKSFNGGAPIEVEGLGNYPTSHDFDLDGLLSGLGVTKDDLVLGDKVTFSFSDYTADGNTYASPSQLVLDVTCKSTLAGEYETSSTNLWCGNDDVTKKVTISEDEAGVYSIDDWSFGAYDSCYDGFEPASWGVLQLKDFCNELTILGLDNYDDTWTLSNFVIDGDKFTFSWANTYGEGARTTITNPNGDWPPLRTP